MKIPSPPLLVITDRKQSRLPLEDMAQEVFKGGCRWLSLREKDLPHSERLALLRILVALGRKWNATVTVHEDIEAARQSGASGLHLPGKGSPAQARRILGAGALIGLSCHDIDDIARAEEEGADYATLSPIFATPSKPGALPLALDELADCATKAIIPVIALGGIGPAEAGLCLEAGASGVAVISAVMAAADPAQATSALVAGLGSP
ncbi:MAG: thiamine phosphate synthase [Stellaceae bacterium]